MTKEELKEIIDFLNTLVKTLDELSQLNKLPFGLVTQILKQQVSITQAFSATSSNRT